MIHDNTIEFHCRQSTRTSRWASLGLDNKARGASHTQHLDSIADQGGISTACHRLPGPPVGVAALLSAAGAACWTASAAHLVVSRGAGQIPRTGDRVGSAAARASTVMLQWGAAGGRIAAHGTAPRVSAGQRAQGSHVVSSHGAH
eukprot:CAMPEP_0177655344 /NCGR_PEP_ID=MMETSP0447-20121125/14907_1 /TAXON_ID=0 /ORGANISM="Stygamoeba regulata, Strain BSH-02190019" /LENGTH=144 /DNA_ID=CAMNT_0019159237 /DNA_START=1212 /DNA_END=1646 /DNA_ORIENTATION=+